MATLLGSIGGQLQLTNYGQLNQRYPNGAPQIAHEEKTRLS